MLSTRKTMQFTSTTILGFFDSSQKSYKIPVYQRAYSWSEKNWAIFLKDLFEQLDGDNNYFFGNILLETIEKGRSYEIIDGQQRIMSLTIFVRAIINILKKRKNETDLKNFDFEEKITIFLKNKETKKLRPVDYDEVFYDRLIIDNESFNAATPSQKKILKAKDFFEEKLGKLKTEKILKLLEKLEKTEINFIEFSSKKDSALMFELENNRGKSLTNMEKIKSYFMYQMYVYSKENETETNIKNIANIFKLIYKTINNIELDEDSILIYHNNTYINGFNYRTLEDVKYKFSKSKNKTEWIKTYITELSTTFSNMEKFEKSIQSSVFASNLSKLKIPAFIYPFIIKGYKYLDNTNLNDLFHILEILTFRTKLINSRANIQERLNSILKDFKEDLITLNSSLKSKLNEEWYWGDENTKNYLNGNLYGNGILNYLLWRYENSIQSKGYEVGTTNIEKVQIEHISPQKPINGECIKTGYDVNSNNTYSEDFINNYLNCVGNLMLISGSHNASIGNKPFKDKLKTYLESPVKQQLEINTLCIIENGAKIWKKESIDKRRSKIVQFALQTWSFDLKKFNQ